MAAHCDIIKATAHRHSTKALHYDNTEAHPRGIAKRHSPVTAMYSSITLLGLSHRDSLWGNLASQHISRDRARAQLCVTARDRAAQQRATAAQQYTTTTQHCANTAEPLCDESSALRYRSTSLYAPVDESVPCRVRCAVTRVSPRGSALLPQQRSFSMLVWHARFERTETLILSQRTFQIARWRDGKERGS